MRLVVVLILALSSSVFGQTGACVHNSGTACHIMGQFDCLAEGGIYLGDGVDCPPTGCCILHGSEYVMTYGAYCASVGGEYQGDGVQCVGGGGPDGGVPGWDDADVALALSRLEFIGNAAASSVQWLVGVVYFCGVALGWFVYGEFRKGGASWSLKPGGL